MAQPVNLTIVIITLGRRPESLRLLLSQLQEQTLPRGRWELIVWQKTPQDMNAFQQINRALHRTRFHEPTDIFIVLGDDHEVREKDFLEKGLSFFEKDPGLMVQTICTTGRMWNDTWEADCRPMLGSGGSLWVRYGAWQAVGEFQVDWGLGVPVLGWRSDSAMLLAIVDKFGMDSYRNTPEVTVYHPGRSESPCEFIVEREFWRRYKKHLRTSTVPIDPRISQVILAMGDENSPEDLALAQKTIDEFKTKGLTEEQARDGVEGLKRLFSEYDSGKHGRKSVKPA